jgi:hypothetical protein
MTKAQQALWKLDVELQKFLTKFEKELNNYEIGGYLITRGVLILSDDFTCPKEELADGTCRYANIGLRIVGKCHTLRDKLT